MRDFREDLIRRIVIIEDNDDLRNAYEMIIRSLEQYFVVASYARCEDALKKIVKDHPDLVLMDLSLPGMSGLEGILKIKQKLSAVKVIVLTAHDDPESVFEAFCAGAIGYITKDSNHIQLIEAINEAFTGGAPMSSKIALMIIRSFHKNPKSPLTDRETDVLRNLAQGKTTDYIARELSVSIDTVKTHIKHIYGKLHVNNRSDAVVKARAEKLV
ncbi:MAG: response regulator transcription factor [Cyclobacteriaceae bacterium]|nr:response regulator transcription factor [Cyclobacteriaceae bacterium]